MVGGPSGPLALAADAIRKLHIPEFKTAERVRTLALVSMFPVAPSNREIIESFYIETEDGLFFAVKGLVHPPDRVIGVLRYVPDPAGERKIGAARYRRLYHFSEQRQFLESACPQYIAFDPVFGTALQSVPRSLIRQVYDPRQYWEWTLSRATDAVVADAMALVSRLQSTAGISSGAIGVTGSLLVGLHRESSDLDLCVYGSENCRRVHAALGALVDSGLATGFCRLDENGIRDLYNERVSDTLMDFTEFAQAERTKNCQGTFQGRPYFIRFIKDPGESGEAYGDFRYQVVGRAKICGVIADDRDSIFTPCRYAVSGVRLLEGSEVSVAELVSFRGRFCEQARTGDVVAAEGTLERVQSGKGGVIYRLLLGNSREDTMTKIPPESIYP